MAIDLAGFRFRRIGPIVEFAFLDARVARQEAFLLEPRTQLEVVLDESTGDAQAERAGLASDAPAGNRGQHVELVGRLGHEQRLLDLGAVRFGGEGLLDRLVIDDQTPVAGAKEHASGGRLAPAGAVVLNPCCHYATSCLDDVMARGFCAACGCSAPA